MFQVGLHVNYNLEAFLVTIFISHVCSVHKIIIKLKAYGLVIRQCKLIVIVE